MSEEEGIYDLIGSLAIKQGATFAFHLDYVDDEGELVDLTGYTAKMQLRLDYNSPTAALTLTNGSGITLGEGVIDVVMTDTQTRSLPAPKTYVYDLEIVSPGGFTTRIVQGIAKVSPEVTR